MQRLVSEEISVRNLRTILEALIEWGQKEKDSVLLLPSASLIQSQQSMQERMSRNTGLPGQTQNR